MIFPGQFRYVLLPGMGLDQGERKEAGVEEGMGVCALCQPGLAILALANLGAGMSHWRKCQLHPTGQASHVSCCTSRAVFLTLIFLSRVKQ